MPNSQSQDERDDVKRTIVGHWGSQAEVYERSPWRGQHEDEAYRHAWRELLVQLTGEARLKILDVGCGPGHLTAQLAELGHTVTGVDMAPEMLALARQRMERAGLRVTLRLGDAERLDDEPDGAYDLVVERHVLWTLPNPASAVAAWQRVLRPGGRAALFEGCWEVHVGQSRYDDELRQAIPFRDGFQREQLVAFLEEHGLRDIEAYDLDVARLWPGVDELPRFLVVGRCGRGDDRARGA